MRIGTYVFLYRYPCGTCRTMSRILPLLALVAVVAIVFGTFRFVRQQRSHTALSNGPAMLYADGDVSYMNSDMAAFEKATSTTPLGATSQVQTASGTAIILLPNDANIALGPQTRITLTYDANNTTVFQGEGETYHRIMALDKRQTYQVKTENSLISAQGTKFAVIYSTSGTTKIGVTEHQVETSQTIGSGTSAQTLHTQTLTEGNAEYISNNGVPQVISLSTDAELVSWTEANLARDQDVDNLERSQGGDLHEALATLFENLLRGGKVIISSAVNGSSGTTTTHATKPATTTQTTSTTTHATTTATSTQTSTSTATSTKPTGETFLLKFRDLFTEYFYLDEKDTPCRFSVTPQERVGIVSNFARESGHSFTSSTLLDFAKEIDAYCSTKSKDRKDETRAGLKARFNAEYPFKS
jgi:hypothetical protein